MANYSYTAGMETRGLNWIFSKIDTLSAPKAGVTSGNMSALQGSVKSFFASRAINSEFYSNQIIILENLLLADGRGGFFNALFVYDPNDPRRLPGDNIRFHDSGQDLPVKRLI